MNSAEFLTAVSIDPCSSEPLSLVFRDQVLKICQNFVIFDAQLDTFRLAHLSVREYLEKRQDYGSVAGHARMAKTCLWDLVARSPDAATQRFLSKNGFCQSRGLNETEILSEYISLFWPEHCLLAEDERRDGSLGTLLRYFLSDEGGITCPLGIWRTGLIEHTAAHQNTDHNLVYELDVTKVISFSAFDVSCLISCVFDFVEILQGIGSTSKNLASVKNIFGQSLLEVAIEHASINSLIFLSSHQNRGMVINEQVLLAAANRDTSAVAIMEAILDRRTHGVQNIDLERVLEAAARSFHRGAGLMDLLVARGSDEIRITEDVLVAAAGNQECGLEILEPLFRQYINEVQITERILKAAVGNVGPCGFHVTELLLKLRRNEVHITEQILETAAGNPHWGMKATDDEVQITLDPLQRHTFRKQDDSMRRVLVELL
ncbi:MAG: hypothetical protein Q9157_002618 [Trypethelium eluteriae]